MQPKPQIKVINRGDCANVNALVRASLLVKDAVVAAPRRPAGRPVQLALDKQ